MNGKFGIAIRIPLKFVPYDPTYNNTALFQVIACRRTAITWTNADPVSWGMYASLGGDE